MKFVAPVLLCCLAVATVYGDILTKSNEIMKKCKYAEVPKKPSTDKECDKTKEVLECFNKEVGVEITLANLLKRSLKDKVKECSENKVIKTMKDTCYYTDYYQGLTMSERSSKTCKNVRRIRYCIQTYNDDGHKIDKKYTKALQRRNDWESELDQLAQDCEGI